MKSKSNIISILLLIKQSVPYYLLAMAGCGFISAVLNVMELYVSRFVIHMVTSSEWKIEKIFLALGIFSAVSYSILHLQIILDNKFQSIKSIQISKDLFQNIFHKIKTIDLSCYENKKFYDDYLKAVNEADYRTFQLVNTLREFITNIMTLFFITTIFFEPVYLLLGVTMVVKELIYLNKINKINFEYDTELVKINRKLDYYGRVFMSVNNIKEIKSNQAYQLFLLKNENEFDQEYALKKKYHYKSLFYSIRSLIISQGANFIIAVWIGIKVLNHTLDAGDFVFLLNSFLMFVTNMTSIFKLIPELKNHNRYIENLRNLLEYQPQIPENKNGLKKPEVSKPEFIFEHVSFSYPNHPDFKVIDNLTLNIKQGEKIAIVGKNGAGKSSFLKILLYLYPVTEGTILYGDKPLSSYCTEDYRSSFGTVFQDFQIYSFSIFENILMRRQQSSEDKAVVEEALDFSGMLERISALPQGMQTHITKEYDSDGVYLSGGEYQRLAISRAYVRASDILIFDEPASSLDPFLEAELFKELMKLGESKTVFYVSHRLTATVHADRILVFDHGELAEQGTHKELMEKDAFYAEMFQCQADRYIEGFEE